MADPVVDGGWQMVQNGLKFMSVVQVIDHPLSNIPTSLIAQTSTAAYTYRPFVTPLPVWEHWIWLLIPLCVGVAVVYKSAKCGKPSDVPREAGIVSLWILAAMIGAAVLLVGVTWATTPK